MSTLRNIRRKQDKFEDSQFLLFEKQSKQEKDKAKRKYEQFENNSWIFPTSINIQKPEILDQPESVPLNQ